MTLDKRTSKKSYHRNKRHYNPDPLALEPAYHNYTGRGYPNVTNEPNEVNCTICRNELIKRGLIR